MGRAGAPVTRGGGTLAIKFGLTEFVDAVLAAGSPATGEGFAAAFPT
jgi:hypothetical protein